jgi:tetratricopeptide (TPR) repeat protein
VVSLRRLTVLGAFCLMLVNTSVETSLGLPKVGQRPVKSVMICYLLNESDYKSRSVGAAIGRMLRYRASNLYQLSNLPPMDVVERVMREEHLGRISLNTRNALRVAMVSGQEWAVVGTVKRSGSRYRIMAYIYDSSSGKQIGRPIAATGVESDLQGLEAGLSSVIFGATGIRFSAGQRADLMKPLTGHPEAVSLLGDYLLAGPHAAPPLLRRLITADPSFPLGAVHRADSLLESGRYWDALTVAREWGSRLPSNRDFASCQFGALLSIGRASEASAVLKRMEAIYPGSFSIALLRYWLLRIQGNDRGAMESGRRLTILNPASSEGYGCYAAAALRAALRISSARAASDIRISRLAAERAVNLDPKYKDAWLTLMAAYREQGDIDRSSLAFKRVIALDARNGEALSSQAVNYLCRNDVKSARKLWSASFSTDRKRGDALVGLALCAKMSGNASMAGGHVRRAAAMDKRCVDVAYLRRQKYWPVRFAQAAAALNSRSRQ